jgi:RNA polymerase sigma-70 factor (ECF subfamily)
MGADVANPDFAPFLQTKAAERDLVEDRHESLGAGKPDSNTQKPYASPSVPSVADTTTKEHSDEHLLARTSEGDREALSLLFRRYAHMVRALAERILRDASEAEDLVQEVFLFVFRKGALFDPERGSARSWLAQVTYHRAFDRRRYLVSRHFYSNLELQEAVFREEEPATLTRLYEDSIEAALGRDALRRIDEALSEAQRLVIRLHFFDGHTLQEIAAVIGQSVGNVRNHYYRALEKMRKEVFTTKLQGK